MPAVRGEHVVGGSTSIAQGIALTSLVLDSTISATAEARGLFGAKFDQYSRRSI